MRPLHLRLTAALALLVAALAVAIVALLLDTTQRYSDEATQRLNAGIAMYIAEELPLYANGAVNEPALEELSRRVMTVNPSAEVYLLDADGRIVDTLVARERLRTEVVDTAAIAGFLGGNNPGATYGEDPTEPGTQRVFSAARLGAGGPNDGYLYVVLGGQHARSIAEGLAGSHALRFSVIVALLLLAVVVAAGAGLFALLTRRLRQLDARMRDWTATLPADAMGRDEIGVLEARFEALRETIDHQLAQLRDTDALRRELVANVSHDLRTPLAALRGYLETIRLKGASLSAAERSRLLDVACRQTEHLGRLIEALFELARLESGAVTADLEAVAVGDLLQDIAMRFRPRADELGVRLVTAIEPDAPLAMADIALMERAVGNILDNALRHTPSGGQVRLELRADARAVRIQVSDTGTGIDAADLPHVFDRYYSGAGHSRSTERGGLGLAIVQRILELHGDRARILSTPHMGTTVQFRLPTRPHPDPGQEYTWQRAG